MKKAISMLLILMLCLSLFPAGAFAEEFILEDPFGEENFFSDPFTADPVPGAEIFGEDQFSLDDGGFLFEDLEEEIFPELPAEEGSALGEEPSDLFFFDDPEITDEQNVSGDLTFGAEEDTGAFTLDENESEPLFETEEEESEAKERKDVSSSLSDDFLTSKNFPDANFLKALKDLGATSGTTKLEIGNRGISDLTGIELFTNLQELNCGDNNLTTLDVSKNTKLSSLVCGGNQITTLKLGSNSALQYLYCNNNKLTTLDVSGNTSLSFLYCCYNQLTTLDVSKNTAMDVLDCSNNKLTTLDLSNNPKMDNLCCESNQLTKLVLSSNPDIYYLSLDCSYNGLATLDLTSFTDIDNMEVTIGTQSISLDGEIKNGEAVIDLKQVIPENLLSRVTLVSDGKYDSATGIATVSKDAEKLTYSFDTGNTTAGSFNVNAALTLEFLTEDNFPDPNFRAKLVSLKATPKTTKLEVYDCDISDLTGIELFPQLQQLACENNNLTELDLSGNPSLWLLQCNDNNLTTLNISENPLLDYIECYSNNLETLDVSGNPLLEMLYCEDNNLTELDLSQNTALEYFTCDNNQLTELNVSANTALKTLTCGSNNLTELDLSQNTALEALLCSDNNLTELDVSHNPNLYALIAGGNSIAMLDLANNPYLTAEEVEGMLTIMLEPQNICLNGEVKGGTATVDLSQVIPEEYLGRVSLVSDGEYDSATGKAKISGDAENLIYSFDTGNTNVGSFNVTAALTLVLRPEITEQPADQEGTVGESVQFTVEASGEGLSYQWQYKKVSETSWSKTTLSGSKTSTLTVPVTAARDGISYRCVVSSSNGTSEESEAATLTVKAAITKQPAAKKGTVGNDVEYSVKATGVGLSYQWQYQKPGSTSWSKTTLTGYDTTKLTVPVTAGRDGYSYRCVVTSSNGMKAESDAATLTVKVAITEQPADETGVLGDYVKYTVKATGADLSYQWYYQKPGGTGWSKSPAEGNQTATLTVPVTASRDGYSYRCVVKASNGTKATSSAAVLSEKSAITQHPSAQTGIVGDNVKYTVKASGTGITYQWQFKEPTDTFWCNSPAEGNQTATLTIPVTAWRDGYSYRCVIRFANGAKEISNVATLTVNAAITTQPADKTVAKGGTAKFTVQASGAGLTYQWQYKTATGSWSKATAEGSTSRILKVPATAARNGYSYRCIVTASNGTKATSNVAKLTVK